MNKKLLSMALILCMVLTLLPTMALAEGVTISGNTTFAENAEIKTATTIQGSDNANAPLVITINEGVTVTATAAITITGNVKLTGGGTLQGSSTNTSSLITVSSGANLTMDGVTITGNTATIHGGGVYVGDGSTFTMNSGNITENTAHSGSGGGVYVRGTFNMTGGSISGNTADSGGGVYVYAGTMKVSGSACVTDNVKGGTITEGVLSGGTPNNVYLNGSNTMTVTGKLTGAIGMTKTVNSSPVDIALGSDDPAYTLQPTDAANIFLDTLIDADGTSGYVVELVSDKLQLAKKTDLVKTVVATGGDSTGTSGKFDTLTNAITELNKTNGGWIIDVQAEQMITAEIPAIIKPVTITSTNGSKIVRGGSYGGILLKINSNVTTTNITIDGDNREVSSEAVLVQNAGTTLHIGSGTVIQNCKRRGGNGAAVFVDRAVAHMTGGSITGNTAVSDGGAAVYCGGNFIMSGGSITGNTAVNGSGVLVDATSPDGFTMNGGSITNNTASGNGGGVCVSNGSMTVGNTASITGNSKGGVANNVYLTDGKTIMVTAPFTGSIGVNSSKTISAGSPVAITGTNSTDYSANFFSDSTDYVIQNSGTGSTQVVQLTTLLKSDTPTVATENATVARDSATAKSVEFTLETAPAGTYKVYDDSNTTTVHKTVDVSVSGTKLTLTSVRNDTETEKYPIVPDNYYITVTEPDKAESDGLKLTVTKAATHSLAWQDENPVIANNVTANPAPIPTPVGDTNGPEVGETVTVSLKLSGTPEVTATHEVGVDSEQVKIEKQTLSVTAGEAIAGGTSKDFTFIMPDTDVKLSITNTFNVPVPPAPDINIYTITATAGENGTISPSGATGVYENGSATYTITPNTSYVIDDVLVDGVSVGAVDSYTFKNVTKAHTISASFKSLWVNAFKDVKETDWFYGAVKFAGENKLFEGTSADTFSPDEPMTRQMFWTVLGRLDGQSLSGVGAYEAAREWGMKKGVTDGTNPRVEITREQLITTLWRYAGSPAPKGSLDKFADAGRVSDYAKQAMIWAVENGLIQGDAGRLNPRESATRAQAAAIFMRYGKSLEK